MKVQTNQTLRKMVRNNNFRHSYCGSVKQMVLDFEKRLDNSGKSQNASRYYGRSISENHIFKKSSDSTSENDFELRFNRYKRMKSLESVYFNPHHSLTITPFPDDLLNESQIILDFPKHKNAKICRIKETAVRRRSKLVDAQDLARYNSRKTFYQSDSRLSAANSNEIAGSSLPLNLLRNDACSVKTKEKSEIRHQRRRTRKVECAEEVSANDEFDYSKGFDEEMSRIVRRMQNIEKEVEQLSIRRNSSLSTDLEELNIYVTDSVSGDDDEDIFGQTDFLKPDDLTFVETYNNLGSEIVFTSVGEVRQRTLSSVENHESGEEGCEIRSKSSDASGVVRRETFYDIFQNPRIEKVSSAIQAENENAGETTARRICHFDYDNGFRSR